MYLVPEAPKRVVEEEIPFAPKKKELPAAEGTTAPLSM